MTASTVVLFAMVMVVLVTVERVELSTGVTAAAAVVVVRFQLQPTIDTFAFGMGGLTTWAPIPIQNINARPHKSPAYAP